jgi:hypothetical protein
VTGAKRSNDAIVWTDAAVPDLPFMFRTGDEFTGVSQHGTIYTSPDGLTWTVSVSGGYPPALTVTSAVWTGYRLLVNGGTHEGGPGRPWTRISDISGTSMAWTGSRAIVATGDTIFTIDDPDASLPPTWRQWQEQYWDESEPGYDAVSDPMADPDGDGWENVFEFMAATSPELTADVPVLTVLPPAGASGARLQWRQDTGRNGVQVRAEITTDLEVWDEAAITAIDGTAGGLRTMQVSAPAGLPRVHFRLKVTLNE